MNEIKNKFNNFSLGRKLLLGFLGIFVIALLSLDALAFVCPIHWEVSDWTACSVPCGSGTRTRTVECRDSLGALIADVDCQAHSSKPADNEACNTFTCDSKPAEIPCAYAGTQDSNGTNDWFFQCSANNTLSKVFQSGTVFNLPYNGGAPRCAWSGWQLIPGVTGSIKVYCDANLQIVTSIGNAASVDDPPLNRCLTDELVTLEITGEDSPDDHIKVCCSRGEILNIYRQKDENDGLFTCSNNFNWVTGPWSSCNVDYCGDGVQTRTVECMDASADSVVADSNCEPIAPKPATVQDCYVPCVPDPACSYEWTQVSQTDYETCGLIVTTPETVINNSVDNGQTCLASQLGDRVVKTNSCAMPGGGNGVDRTESFECMCKVTDPPPGGCNYLWDKTLDYDVGACMMLVVAPGTVVDQTVYQGKACSAGEVGNEVQKRNPCTGVGGFNGVDHIDEYTCTCMGEPPVSNPPTCNSNTTWHQISSNIRDYCFVYSIAPGGPPHDATLYEGKPCDARDLNTTAYKSLPCPAHIQPNFGTIGSETYECTCNDNVQPPPVTNSLSLTSTVAMSARVVDTCINWVSGWNELMAASGGVGGHIVLTAYNGMDCQEPNAYFLKFPSNVYFAATSTSICQIDSSVAPINFNAEVYRCNPNP